MFRFRKFNSALVPIALLLNVLVAPLASANFEIEGTVTDNSLPVSGVKIYSGFTAPITTDVNGYYKFSNIPSGTLFRIEAVKAGSIFQNLATQTTPSGYLINIQTIPSYYSAASNFTSVSNGAHHFCALTNSGKVMCWGNNYSGGLGDGSETLRRAPVEVKNIGITVQQISTGEQNSCALTSAGGVICWGASYATEASATPSALPYYKAGLSSGVSQIAVGRGHSCVVMTDRTVKCWGNNYGYQLGNDNGFISSDQPVNVVGVSDANKVCVGNTHSCVLTTSGAVKCWGYNYSGEIGDGSWVNRSVPTAVSGLNSSVVDISCYLSHSCAILQSGEIRCWGSNRSGQLGMNSNIASNIPVTISSPPASPTMISTGDEHSCVVSNSNSVYCWGGNFYYQLGSGNSTSSLVPIKVLELEGTVISLSAKGYRTCAVLGTGEIKCWGMESHWDGKEQLEWNGSSFTLSHRMTPDSVLAGNFSVQGTVLNSNQTPLSGVTIRGGLWGETTSDASGAFSLDNIPLENDYTIIPSKEGYTFNPAVYRGVIHGPITANFEAIPVSKPLTGSVSAIETGGANSCLIEANGVTRCWGQNGNGTVGDASKTLREFPKKLSVLGTGVRQVSLGLTHACAITSGRLLKCWGLNGDGQLGDNTTTLRTQPVSIAGALTGFTNVACGQSHTCATTEAGAAYCWGSNYSGCLGDGTTTRRKMPTPVSGLSQGVLDVCTGWGFSCALVQGGAVKCWGDMLEEKLTPETIVGLESGVRQLSCSAGSSNACAVTEQGAVKCWGSNYLGALGDGSYASNYYSLLRKEVGPTQVLGLTSGVSQVAVGTTHACALLVDGSVKCWGDNTTGALGAPIASATGVPQSVIGLPEPLTSISAGAYVTCGVTTSGHGVCWGSNDSAQIGDDTRIHRFAPSPILRGYYALQGLVNRGSTPLSGVAVAGGDLGNTTTNNSGIFSFTEIPFGSPYSLTLSALGYAITPASPVTGTVSTDTSLIFGAELLRYKVYGSVKLSGKGVAGVSIRGGSLGNTTTDANGNFVYNSVGFGTSYSIAASRTGYLFTPNSITGTVSGTKTISFAAEKLDADDDGLADLDEPSYGTSPTNPDSDGDGVMDGQEVLDKTNPLDSGSANSQVGSEVCTEWNGFLGGMMNIVEHVNLGVKSIGLESTLYNSLGAAQSSFKFGLAQGGQYDLIANSMKGWVQNSYGKVCSRMTSGAVGTLDGRMVYYKPDAVGGYQFAFAMPFGNGRKGNQYVHFNTEQPSLAAIDSANLVTNWIQITNLQKATERGTVKFYNMSGVSIGAEKLTLKAGARQDIVGHRAVKASGLVEWIPDNKTSNFQVRNVRYYYDNSEGKESFAGAFQFEAIRGSGSLLAAPVDTRNSGAQIQISNVSGQKQTIEVRIYNAAGSAVLSLSNSLVAHGTWNIAAENYLKNAQGVLTVRGPVAGSVMAYVVQTERDSSGAVRTLYGIAAEEPVGTVLQGSYNTFLNQECRLLLVNPTDVKVDATISMTRYDRTQVLKGAKVSVPKKGLVDYDLCAKESEPAYGVVTVQQSATKALIAKAIRVGANDDYRFPTPVR